MELQDREKENLGQYLRNGGFLFADDMRPSTTPKGIEAGSVGTSFAQHFKALLQDPLVLGADGAKWKKVPPDHPLYTSFWDLNNGPPLGAAPAGNLHGLEMLELRGRVVALVSHLNLSRFWDNPNTADHLGGLQLGINLIVFALTQHVPSHNIDIDWPRPALNRTPG